MDKRRDLIVKPKFFRLGVFDDNIRASFDDACISSSRRIPEGYNDVVSFFIQEVGDQWPDVITIAGSGLMLFSEQVKTAFESDGVVGLTFNPTNIDFNTSGIGEPGARPDYFWGRAVGVIEVDPVAYKKNGRFIPISVTPDSGVDLFHVKYPDSLTGYCCTYRVLETFRKHGVTNLYINPLDYNGGRTSDIFAPQFSLDIGAGQWPPACWYPDDFEPHPNNLIE